MKQDTKTNSEVGSHNESSEQTSTLPLSRRSVLLTMTAGSASASLTATTVAADAEEEIDIEFASDDEIDNAPAFLGGNEHGIPQELKISAESEITVHTEEITDGIVELVVEAKPDEGGYDFREIGEGAFEVDGDEYKFTFDQIPEGGRDLFTNPDIDPQQSGDDVWNVDEVNARDLDDLEETDARYEEATIAVRIKAEAHGSEVDWTATGEDNFTVYFARTGGLGVNLGYCLGKKWPVAGEDPDFDGVLGDS